MPIPDNVRAVRDSQVQFANNPGTEPPLGRIPHDGNSSIAVRRRIDGAVPTARSTPN